MPQSTWAKKGVMGDGVHSDGVHSDGVHSDGVHSGRVGFGRGMLSAASLLVALLTSAGQASGTTGTVALDRSAESPGEVGYDRATLVILAPRGPVVADLQISVGRRPYRQWVGMYLANLLDVDRSGTLDASELNQLSEQLRKLTGVSGSDQILRSVSEDGGAVSVDTQAFAAWFRHQLPQTFAVSALPGAAEERVPLLSLLDLNQDGAISEDELTAAAETLRFRDLDDDQTFSVSELMPYRDPRTQDAGLAPDVASLPFFEVTDAESARRAASRLVVRYSESEQQWMADCHRGTEDGWTEFLQDPEFHLTIEVRLSDLANRSSVSIQLSEAAIECCQVQQEQLGTVKLLVDRMPITFVARGGGANNRAYLRGFLGQNFLMYDNDRNQYLDEAEFTAMSSIISQAGAVPDFAAADTDGDGMVTRDELFLYVDREVTSASSQIEVSVEQQGRSLFGLLDENQDRRLSLRELMQGWSRLQSLDLTANGRLSGEDLETEYRVTIGLGRSEIRKSAARGPAMMTMQRAGAGDAILPGVDSLSGPEWFRRMDRNQDGDVSRREFIGTLEMFDAMDLDGDGLISVDEAAAFATTGPDGGT